MPISSRSLRTASVRSGGSFFRYDASATIWMTPPFFASALIWSSSRFRSAFATVMQPECEAIIGAFDAAMTSQNDFAAMCDTSTMMPRRFISATTFLPNGERPLCSGGVVSLDESQIWLCPLWLSVM